jgi:hypothetical protein
MDQNRSQPSEPAHRASAPGFLNLAQILDCAWVYPDENSVPAGSFFTPIEMLNSPLFGAKLAGSNIAAD